jgi:hypothetical protein
MTTVLKYSMLVIKKHGSYFKSDTHFNKMMLDSASSGQVVRPYWHVVVNYTCG